MPQIINTNIMSLNSQRSLNTSQEALQTSLQRLSSGLRINSAKDDAAGLAVRELMRADIAVLEQGARNALDGISMLQTFEGAMGTIDDALVRLKSLAEQAATGSYSSAQRTIMNNEFDEMAAEINRIAGAVDFNGNQLLNSATATISIQFGAATTDKIDVTGSDMTSSALGLSTASIATAASARAAVDLAVPLSPRMSTPPISGLMAFRIKPRFIGAWPTMAVKGKIGITCACPSLGVPSLDCKRRRGDYPAA